MKKIIIKWASKSGNGNLFFTSISFVLWSFRYITYQLRSEPGFIDSSDPFEFVCGLASGSLHLSLKLALICGSIYLLLKLFSFFIILKNPELKEAISRDKKDETLIKYRKRLGNIGIKLIIATVIMWLLISFAVMVFKSIPDIKELGVLFIYPIMLLEFLGEPAIICCIGYFLIRLYSFIKIKLIENKRIPIAYIKYILYTASIILQVIAYKYILFYLWS